MTTSVSQGVQGVYQEDWIGTYDQVSTILLGLSFLIVLILVIMIVFFSSNLLSKLTAIRDLLLAGLSGVFTKLASVGEYILKIFNEFTAVLINKFAALSDFIFSGFNQLAGFLQTQIETTITHVTLRFEQFATQGISTLMQGITTLGVDVINIFTSMSQVVNNAVGQLGTVLPQIVTAFESFVTSVFSKVFKWIQSVLSTVEYIVNEILGFL